VEKRTDVRVPQQLEETDLSLEVDASLAARQVGLLDDL